jgi:hypothetical protein
VTARTGPGVGVWKGSEIRREKGTTMNATIVVQVTPSRSGMVRTVGGEGHGATRVRKTTLVEGASRA